MQDSEVLTAFVEQWKAGDNKNALQLGDKQFKEREMGQEFKAIENQDYRVFGTVKQEININSFWISTKERCNDM